MGFSLPHPEFLQATAHPLALAGITDTVRNSPDDRQDALGALTSNHPKSLIHQPVEFRKDFADHPTMQFTDELSVWTPSPRWGQ